MPLTGDDQLFVCDGVTRLSLSSQGEDMSGVDKGEVAMVSHK